MYKKIYTFAEIEAANLCIRSGLFSSSNDDLKKATEYILSLAERIKNERSDMTMHLAANNNL